MDIPGMTVVQSAKSAHNNVRPDDVEMFTSSAQRDSYVGTNYLDIVMQSIFTGMSIDSELYARLQASFTSDAHTTCSIAEVADSLSSGSSDSLTPQMIISKIWSKNHPELARDLKQFVIASCYPHMDGRSVPNQEAGAPGMDTTESRDARRHCSCGGRDTDNMIACYNATCTHGWFHLACKGLVVTPPQGEKWFCSDDCEEAEAQESDSDDASDSDDY
jgi:hypothetical protein